MYVLNKLRSRLEAYAMRTLFGTPPILTACDPRVHQAIIARSEQRVYGKEGLAAYEERETFELRRLARRSFAQHLCHEAMVVSRLTRFARFWVCAVCLPCVLAYCMYRAARGRLARASSVTSEQVVVVAFAERLRLLLEPSRFRTPLLWHDDPSFHFGLREVGFLLRVIWVCKPMLLYPPFLLNLVRWLSYYGCVVRRSKARTVVAFFERTPSCSLMTAYLHELGRRHINVQHGERWFIADAAFSEFDEIHVWGAYFAHIFAWQQSRALSIEVSGNSFHNSLFCNLRVAFQPRPKRMLILVPSTDSEAESSYQSLLQVLHHLDVNWEVRIRRHPAENRPRLGFVENLRQEPSLAKRGVIIEEELPSDITMADALRRTRVVVGTSSAAMIDAWVAGCKVLHLPSPGHKATLMDRYGGSRNALYLDSSVGLEEFLRTPAVLDAEETQRVEFLTHIDAIRSLATSAPLRRRIAS